MAMALLVKHPDWTDKKIAEEIGVARTTLYTWERYKQLRQMLKEKGILPRGYRDPEGNLEAKFDRGEL